MTTGIPVIFIHGLWLHATSWQPWADLFGSRGYQPVIPAPGKPLFEAAAANFSLHSPAKVNTENSGRGPLLLIMGGQDHTVPEIITKATLKQYRHSEADRAGGVRGPRSLADHRQRVARGG